MDNRISAINSVSFGRRYLNIQNPETFPKKIYDAIYKSDGIEAFLYPKKPKSVLKRIINFFRKDKPLNVTYGVKEKQGIDPFARTEFVTFSYMKNNKEVKLPLSESQEGIRRRPGTIAREGENKSFKAPLITATDILAEKIETLKDFGKLLK